MIARFSVLRGTAAATLLLPLTFPTPLRAQRLVPDVSLVEVTRVGGPDEVNAHFISRAHAARLLDSVTIAYVEPDGTRRLTVADLLSGEGWDLFPGSGVLAGSRPTGLHPEAFVFGDTIRVVDIDGRYATLHRSGQFLGEGVVSPPVASDSLGGEFLSGFVRDGVPVYHYVEVSPKLRPGLHTARQGLRVGDESHPMDDLDIEVWSEGDRRAWGASPPSHSTRGDLTAYSHQGSRDVTLLSPSGQKTVDVGWPVEAVRVDGSQRIWIRLHRIPVDGDGYGWLVLDRDGEEVMRVVPPRHFVDAFGDWVLTQEYTEPDTPEWALYRIARR